MQGRLLAFCGLAIRFGGQQHGCSLELCVVVSAMGSRML